MFPQFVFIFLLLIAQPLIAQSVAKENEQAASSAEAERNVMTATLEEIYNIVGKDSLRGKMYQESQNQWLKYQKEQAKADANGVSGQAAYPRSYFKTMRELSRYRTRVLEGCLSRLEAEKVGGRGSESQALTTSRQSDNTGSARNWKKEVGEQSSAAEVSLYEAKLEGVNGILSGQWISEKLWRGVFSAERGDTMMLYGGKMDRGGIVFEAWQEGTRIGRGFVRKEGKDLRGRFFDVRRREWPVVMKARKRPTPASYTVGKTTYSGLVGTEPLDISLEWHDSRFVRGSVTAERTLLGHNYSQGKLFLAERKGSNDGPLIAVWSLAKKKSGQGATRWIGSRQVIGGQLEKVDFGR